MDSVRTERFSSPSLACVRSQDDFSKLPCSRWSASRRISDHPLRSPARDSGTHFFNRLLAIASVSCFLTEE